MCDPLTIATVGLSMGQAVMGVVGQQQQAAAQNAYYAQNAENARVAFQDKQAALTERQSQEQDAASEQKFDATLQARADKATNVVAAGASGISGLSVEGLLGDIDSKAGRYNARVDQQTDWTMTQLQQEKTAAGDQMVSQVNSVRKGVAPSFLDAGLRIAGAGLGSYSNSLQRNRVNS